MFPVKRRRSWLGWILVRSSSFFNPWWWFWWRITNFHQIDLALALLHFNLFMTEMLGDQVCEVWSFLHCRLEHAVKALALLEILFKHANDCVFLLA